MVSDLLKQSVSEHTRALLLRRAAAKGQAGAKEEARTVLTHARDLRLQALSEDQERADPAWAAERVPHHAMMSFYQEQLGDP